MLSAGASRTIEALPKRERVNRCYMIRVLRLTLLAPDVVQGDPRWAAGGGDAAG